MAIRRAAARKREECAKLAEAGGAEKVAEAIRARGENQKSN